jgi:hypothetical protein
MVYPHDRVNYTNQVPLPAEHRIVEGMCQRLQPLNVT